MSNVNKKNFRLILKRLFSFMKPYKLGLYISILFIILSSFFGSISPFILGKATDAMISLTLNNMPVYENIQKFIAILVTLGVSYILFSLFKYLSITTLVKVSQKTIFSLRDKLDKKFVKLPLNYFDTNTYGDILSRVTNDVDTISNALQQSIEQLINAITSIIFILIMMIIISPLLTLVGIITIPLALFISLGIANKAQKHFKAQQDTMGEINGYVEEMYTGHLVISAFSKEQDTIDEFEDINNRFYKSGFTSQFLSSTLMPITQGMTNLGYVLVTVISGVLVITGKMSIGMIQSFIQYLRQFSQPINQTVQISNVIQSTIAASSRIFEFLDEKEEIEDKSISSFPQNIDGKVEFQHVEFGYLPNKLLMKNVDITINPGNKVAIVGPTGAGKTTLINLLLRFYDVNSGAIKINDIDIRDVKRKDLRKIFGIVLQDTWLFTGTIRENIRYGNLQATDKEVENAAKLAHADGFIRTLPNGYNMVLYEGGSNLAQGEKQLLTIARAILSNSPIMILDEATSSVDTRTELIIQKAMANLLKNRTSFVIAHRLSTIKDADLIIYMENGDIKETGTHQELILKNGLYNKLYESQFANNS